MSEKKSNINLVLILSLCLFFTNIFVSEPKSEIYSFFYALIRLGVLLLIMFLFYMEVKKKKRND